MGPFFGRNAHRFRQSSLSNSVPLDGCDTVAGLRQLDRHRRSSDLNTFLERNITGLQNFGRTGYCRYKGPYLDQLQQQDIWTAPIPWLLALCGGSRRHWDQAYNVPEHSAMLQERLEENFVRYRGNYIRMAAVAMLLVTLLRPWGFIGLCCTGLLLYLNLTHPLDNLPVNGYLEKLTGSFDAAANVEAHASQSPLHSMATVALTILIFYSRSFLLLPRCFLAALLSVLLHASLRRAGSEYGFQPESFMQAHAAAAELPRARGVFDPAASTIRAAADCELCKLAASCRPGVGLDEVWKGHMRGSPRSGREAVGVEDPRMVFRELWGHTKQVGQFLGGWGKRLSVYYWHEALERLRYWRIPSHL